VTDETEFGNTQGTVFAGGLALVLGAGAFMGVFVYLANSFQYPDVLDGNVKDVLPALLATGDAGRTAWSCYSLLPLLFVPAAVASFEALKARARGPMRVGMFLAVIAAFAMMLGLMRWPSIHWELARAWRTAGEGERLALAAVFDGLNRYLGNFVGEFLGEFCLNFWFVLCGIAILRVPKGPRALGWWGLLTGVLGLVGAFRNVVPAFGRVAVVNNILLPAWMIGFGAWMMLNAKRTGRAVDGPPRA